MNFEKPDFIGVLFWPDILFHRFTEGSEPTGPAFYEQGIR